MERTRADGVGEQDDERETLGPKEEEFTGSCRKLHGQEPFHF